MILTIYRIYRMRFQLQHFFQFKMYLLCTLLLYSVLYFCCQRQGPSLLKPHTACGLIIILIVDTFSVIHAILHVTNIELKTCVVKL